MNGRTARPPQVPTCDFAATCGRPLGHRGHCGGWRSGVRGVDANPVEFDVDRAKLGTDLGPADVKVLVDYAAHGSSKIVADCLDMPVQSVKNHLTAIHTRTGSSSTIASLRALGWITIPSSIPDKHRGETVETLDETKKNQ